MPGFELIGTEEQAEINEIFARGGVLFRHGFDALRNDCFKVREFEAAFAAYMKVPHALAVTSGTAALRVALAVLDLQPGDEVITQSFTFVATAEAIIEARAVPVCCEVDATLNMDPIDLERRITPRTRAVSAVHMLGTPARLQEISAVCSRHNVVLIEDAARVRGVMRRSKSVGSMFNVASTSQHTGTALASMIASAVATKVKLWVMTSSPGCRSSTASATRSAAVPEVTARACGTFM
ncbi:MAG: DegT/DnrJ/EryC1/StrS family aminotransferase [Actinomycetota bacterium]